jgi:hypothetical protein
VWQSTPHLIENARFAYSGRGIQIVLTIDKLLILRRGFSGAEGRLFRHTYPAVVFCSGVRVGSIVDNWRQSFLLLRSLKYPA